MMGCQGTATLGDNIGMGDVILIGCFGKGIYTVVHILLYAVVDAALAVAASGAVVVNAQAAAAVHELDIEAHLVQLHVILGHLTQSGADSANLGYLATDMEVYQFQAVTQSHFVKELQCHEQL